MLGSDPVGMKTLWQRLRWAVVGYRTEPWPVLPPPPQVLSQAELESVFDNRLPGGVLSPYQHEHLRGSIKLAADLLAPHFQSALSAASLGSLSGRTKDTFQTPDGKLYASGLRHLEPEVAMTQYLPAATDREEIDLLLSGAAWLAKQSALTEEEFRRLFLVASDDIYHPER